VPSAAVGGAGVHEVSLVGYRLSVEDGCKKTARW
jgi:hypothetical protein